MSLLRETFLHELAAIYDAEKQLVKALPKMAQAAEHPELKEAFEVHQQETETQVQRLEQIFKLFNQPARGKANKAMQALIAEGEDLIEEEAGDAALICASQKVEHYEMASYGSLAAWGSILEEEDAVNLLQESLDEETLTDEKLTEIAELAINAEEAEEEEEESESRRRQH